MMRSQYCRSNNIHGILRSRKLLAVKSFPSCMCHLIVTTSKGRNILMAYIAWNATVKLFPLPISAIKYTKVVRADPEVAISVEIRTWMGPRWVSKCSFEPSIAAAAEVGYSPPTPTPAVPRAMIMYQSMALGPWTWKKRVDIKLPTITRPEVTSTVIFR
jgi:hypothetical protein